MNQNPANSLYSSYSGISSTNPFVEIFLPRSPTIYDVNYPIQKRWYDTVLNLEFVLVGFTTFSGELNAIWVTPATGGGGGLVWFNITSPTFQMITEEGYFTDTSAVTYTLPRTANLGDTIRVVGKTGISTIVQNTGQKIVFGNKSTTITSGSLVATKNADCVELVCSTAGTSTVFTVDSSIGNWIIN